MDEGFATNVLDPGFIDNLVNEVGLAAGLCPEGAPEKRRRIDDRERFGGPYFLKLLVPDQLAGAIIGRAGETLAALEQSTGACLKIAQAGSHYPGTTERAVVIAGDQQAVLRALSEGIVQPLDDLAGGPGGRLSIRILAPKAVCGSIIGKGGHQVRQICQVTSAHINVLPVTAHLAERIVQLQGTRTPVEQAAGLVLERLCAEENAEQIHNNLAVDYDVRLSQGVLTHQGGSSFEGYAAIGQADPAAALAAAYSSAQSATAYEPSQGTPYWSVVEAHPDALDEHCLITLQVTELQAGVILGKHGRQIQEITQFTRTRVQLSQREPGADINAPRSVDVSGRAEDVHAAHLLLLKCMKAAQESMVPADSVKQEFAAPPSPNAAGYL